jgi:hypothetical protein
MYDVIMAIINWKSRPSIVTQISNGEQDEKPITSIPHYFSIFPP